MAEFRIAYHAQDEWYANRDRVSFTSESEMSFKLGLVYKDFQGKD